MDLNGHQLLFYASVRFFIVYEKMLNNVFKSTLCYMKLIVKAKNLLEFSFFHQ